MYKYNVCIIKSISYYTKRIDTMYVCAKTLYNLTIFTSKRFTYTAYRAQ